jgi:hypothetical protein
LTSDSNDVVYVVEVTGSTQAGDGGVLTAEFDTAEDAALHARQILRANGMWQQVQVRKEVTGVDS